MECIFLRAILGKTLNHRVCSWQPSILYLGVDWCDGTDAVKKLFSLTGINRCEPI